MSKDKSPPVSAAPEAAPPAAPLVVTPVTDAKLAPAMPAAVADLKLTRRQPAAREGSAPVRRHSFLPKSVKRVTAATGVPDAPAELPSFLQGPEAGVRAVRHDAEKARTALAQLLTTVQTQLPGAAAALQAVEDAPDGPEIAKTEGFDVSKARSLVDSLTRLLQGLK